MDASAQTALNTFPQWLQSLGGDLVELTELLKVPELSEKLRLWIAGASGYIFKSIDLIPDGIEDLGYLDDAFVVRVIARHAAEHLDAEIAPAVLTRLAGEAAFVESFLGTIYTRLDEFVLGLRIAVVRGRSPSDIVQDPALAQQVCDEVAAFARSYIAPQFTQEERTLTKLRSFLDTKLP
jgi:uncharacterized membrane protein YkvA (DUF1232 family)